jgi:hypothetical protein
MATSNSVVAKNAEKPQPDTEEYASKPRHYRDIKLTRHRCDFTTLFDVVVGPETNRKTYTL